jgi:hypothetical protein
MNSEKYLPFENHLFTTTLSTLEVLHRIKENIEPNQGFILASSKRRYSKPYTGQINGLTFSMTRNINYRNSFIPVITGQLITYSNQTEVKVKMRLNTFVLVFITFWLGTVGLVCLGEIITGLLRFKQILFTGFSPALIMPFIMFTFGYLLVILAFKAESKKSMKFLEELFNTEPSHPRSFKN